MAKLSLGIKVGMIDHYLQKPTLTASFSWIFTAKDCSPTETAYETVDPSSWAVCNKHSRVQECGSSSRCYSIKENTHDLIPAFLYVHVCLFLISSMTLVRFLGSVLVTACFCEFTLSKNNNFVGIVK